MPKKQVLKFVQKLEKVLLNLRQQNRINGSLKEVLTIR